ncbi:hypothetical protein A4G18_07335 [Pasteurellaceae bacterium Pebbles2]|nr:hypothetical protein [Pasteurellaceae bacterium Pebbles2]
MGEEIEMPYWQRCCCNARLAITGSFYRLENAYNKLPLEDKELWCVASGIAAFDENGRTRAWNELSEEERLKLKAFLKRMSGFLGRLPKGLKGREFYQVTKNERN